MKPLLRLAYLTLLVVFLLAGLAPAPILAQQAACDEAILHYQRTNADYDGWGLHVWGPAAESVTWEQPLQPAGEDDFGLYWVVGMNPDADLLNYIVHKGDEKDPGPDQTLTFAEIGCEIWLVQGRATQFTDPESATLALIPVISESPPPGPNQVILHYHRVNEDYDGWGLHIWGPTAIDGVTWTSPLLPAGQDEYGLYWIVDMQPGATTLNYIVHKGDEKDPGPDQSLDITALGREIWLIQGTGDQFTDPAAAIEGLRTAGLGDIRNKAQAHWVTADTLAWPADFLPRTVFKLHFDRAGGLELTPDGLQGGQEIELEYAGDRLAPQLAAKLPHLLRSAMLKIPAGHLDQAPEILKGQIAVAAYSPDGDLLNATAVQIPGVLDDLYANDLPLGVTWDAATPTLRVWAPTARSVTLHLYPDSDPATVSTAIPMEWQADTGVWQVAGQPEWRGQFYLYEVEVYVRQEGRLVNNFVTDPYSLSLAMNSARSQIVDLNDPDLAPDGWADVPKPPLEHPADIIIYELHVRDFSAHDPSVPPERRGAYLAFTDPQTNGMRHLRRLAEAGLTHLHLLPVFDIATINEDKTTWQELDFAAMADLPPDSEEQQAASQAIRDQDGFNWGYDPYHFTTPEGSYATDPDGSARIKEFRQMVMGLNQAGLRVVMDVVYNHTNASGQAEKSVLDRLVPGYYHRLDANGSVATSTCCANTATEHAMMEKLMVDSLLTWARDYKVDGFRFDLMGHHMVANMEKVRAELDVLTVAADGVDGGSIYVYGEGWNFGEVADGARGPNATQLNLAGSGLGTFNDRLRDAARGGSPFSGLQEQGFINGLYVDPNEVSGDDPVAQLSRLLDLKDKIRIGLAGNLADYQFRNATGQLVRGAQIIYNGQPAGYTQMPQENIVYVSAHDNETLFDAIQYKAPLSASPEDRVRMQALGLSLVAFSQGIPFFHAGDELLRSKSLDRDSYDSGDWFNRLDYTYATNNWGAGLPLQDKNGANWPLMRELLANPDLAVSSEHILASLAHFEELLQIRRSSPLFRLRTAEQVQEQVHFHNLGPDQQPGLIVMSISDNGPASLDENYDLIVVLFNASPEPVAYTLAELVAPELALHPVQAASADPLIRTAGFDPTSKTFSVPGRTTAVFAGRGELGEPGEAVAPEPTAVVEPTPLPEPTAAVQPAEPPPAEIETAPSLLSLWPWLVGLAVAAGLGGLVIALRQRGRRR